MKKIFGRLKLNYQKNNLTGLKNKIKEISNQSITDRGFICSINILCELGILSKAQIKD